MQRLLLETQKEEGKKRSKNAFDLHIMDIFNFISLKINQKRKNKIF